jgi:DHA1 family multidrug resistance protein-like MFS transporter
MMVHTFASLLLLAFASSKAASTAFSFSPQLSSLSPSSSLLSSLLSSSSSSSILSRGRPTSTTTRKPIGTGRCSAVLLVLSAKLNEKDNHENNNHNNKTIPTIFGFPRETVAAPLALLLISQFFLFVGVGAVIPSIPLYGKEIGLSSAANGVVISAPAVTLLLGAKQAGNFADAARKPAMILGMAVIAVSDVGTACASGLATLVMARLGLGLGRCISEAGERGMLADLAGRAPELRGRVLAAQQAVIALGIAVGAPLGGLVVEQYGPRASFLCVSAAAIVALLIYYLFLPETTTTTQASAMMDDDDDLKVTCLASAEAAVKSSSYNPGGAAGAGPSPLLGRDGDWKDLLAMNQWRGLALCQSGASFGFAAKISTIPILAAATLPGGAAGAGALISACGLAGLVGAPIGGWLTDRTSAKSTAIFSGITSAAGLVLVPVALGLSSASLDAVTATVVATTTGSTELPSLFGQILSTNALAFSAVVIAWSIGAAAQGPALTAYAQELAPHGAEATAMALPRAAGDGTYIVAPFLLGLIADSWLDMPGAECAAAGIATLLGVLSFAMLGDDGNDDDDSFDSGRKPRTKVDANVDVEKERTGTR